MEHTTPDSDLSAPDMREASLFAAKEMLKRQTVRRKELQRLVPLSDTTIYEMEQKGEFPKRFYLTPRCVVWPLGDVLEWIDERREASLAGATKLAPHPDYRLRGKQ